MSDSNYKWFSNHIREKRLTQRALAKLLEMDPSSLSLLLHGKRRMRVEQAAEIARFLGVPVSEVVKHGGGTDVPDHIPARREPASLPVVGWLDEGNRARLDWTKTDQRFEVIEGYPPTAVAIQWRTAHTRASIWDGWMAIALPPREVDHDDMVDRLCLVGVKGGSEILLRTVGRGYTPGKYNLLDFINEPMHDVELSWFSPVLAIKPA